MKGEGQIRSRKLKDYRSISYLAVIINHASYIHSQKKTKTFHLYFEEKTFEDHNKLKFPNEEEIRF